MNTPTPPVQPAAPVPAVKPATAKPATADIQALLGTDQPARWWARPSLWIGLAVLAAAAGGIYFWQAQKESNAAPVYVTEALRKGNLTLTVAANGTIVPTRVVSIGSELSGTVKRVLVDVNDVVKKGQVLVELDTAKLDDQVLRSRAALASAQAQLAQTNATVKEARAGLARFEEVSRLSGGKVPSATELDGARATLERAVAGEASASATVAEARATLSTDETNLSKASIRSPINGVVLTRTVDPGNAVAASLQAVTLFTIAEDLAQLRLEVAVDEADVGAVKVGQKASFTVSAYPSRRYPARITRVAFGSTKTDNVITYTTWLEVDNSDLSLRPGMTAAATVAAPAASGSVVSKLMPRMPPRSGGRRAAGNGNAAVRQIWVLQDGQAVALAVTPGISDGRMTEVSGPELKEGMAVITDQRAAGAAP